MTIHSVKKLADKTFQKIDWVYLSSFSFFIVCTILDFSITTIGSGGDWTMEGDVIAQFWWKIAGVFRFIEIPIWMFVAFCLTSFVYSKNKFLGLLWLNLLAFNHLLGFFTWLPYEANSIATIFTQYTYKYPIGLISIVLSVPISIVQFTISRLSQKISKGVLNGSY